MSFCFKMSPPGDQEHGMNADKLNLNEVRLPWYAQENWDLLE